MTITTYATLKTAIADFLNRDDLTSVVPTFIRLAESRISREIRHWRMETRSTAQLDTQYSAIPADYLSPIRLQITDAPTSEVSPISTAQLLQLRGDREDRVGRPVHYALTAGGIELFPTPDETYNASLVYYARVPALSDSTTTNWLLTEAPDVYLYGALVHAAPYLKDDARIQIWEAFHAQAIDNLNTSSSDAKYGGSGLVMRSRRGAF
jgi:hypothetical protein